jgi:hypothetical protein
MEKNIPIDQLFKNNLSEGQEQLNLGAWANMERILDGKNPYAEEATNKKRKLVPFFLAFFILIGGLLTAGYINLSKSKSSKNKSLIVSKQPQIIQKGAVETIEPTNIPPTENHSSPTQPTSTYASSSEQKNISTPEEAITSTKNENSGTEKDQDLFTLNEENTSKYGTAEPTENLKSNAKNSLTNQHAKSLDSKKEGLDKGIIQSATNSIDESKVKKENQKITTDNNKIANTTLKKDTIAVIEIKEKTSKNRQSKNVEYDTLGRYNKVVESTVSNIVDQENKPFFNSLWETCRFLNF